MYQEKKRLGKSFASGRLFCYIDGMYNCVGGRQLIVTTKPNYMVKSGIKNYAHDTAPNPVIAVSFLIVMIYMLVKFRKTRWKSLTDRYTLATGIAFLIFCMAVRWEPFVVRYMLSYLALLCPVIALQVQEVEDRSGTGKGIRTLLVFLCMVDLIGLFYYHINICYNQLASSKRSDGYFFYNEGQKESYDDLAAYLNQKDYQNIGLYMGGYEYPIWAMLKDKSTRIESLGVEKRSLIYADPDFVPECIVSMEVGNVTAIKYNGVEYSLSDVIDNRIYILTRQK